MKTLVGFFGFIVIAWSIYQIGWGGWNERDEARSMRNKRRFHE
jgi:hypothetical protein